MYFLNILNLVLGIEHVHIQNRNTQNFPELIRWVNLGL